MQGPMNNSRQAKITLLDRSTFVFEYPEQGPKMQLQSLLAEKASLPQLTIQANDQIYVFPWSSILMIEIDLNGEPQQAYKFAINDAILVEKHIQA